MKKVMYVVSRYEFSDLDNSTAVFKNFKDAWFWARNKAWEEAGWEEDEYPKWEKFDSINDDSEVFCMTYNTVFRECGFIIRKKIVREVF